MGIEALTLGLLLTTGYQSEPRFTDNTPFHTSIGEKVHPHGIAASQDLLCPASLFKDLRIKRHKAETCHLKHKLHYHDLLWVEGVGFKILNDTMNKRHRNHVDVWCASHEQEKKLKPQKRKVLLVRGKA